MRIYSLHFLGTFLRRFVWVFIFIKVFLGLCAFFAFLPKHPYVPLTRVIAGVPDLALALLPVSLPFSLVLAVVLFIEDVRRQQGFLWIQLAGRDPRLFQTGIIAFGALASLGLWGFNASVLPKIQFHSNYVLTRPEDTMVSLALRMEREPELLQGLQMDFRFEEGARLADFSLVSADEGAHMIVTAASAVPDLDDEGGHFGLELSRGRLLKADVKGGLATNLRFDKFRLRFDALKLFGADKKRILNPVFYTNRELSLLPETARLQERSGLLLSKRQKRRIKAIPQVVAARVQSAMNPFLFTLVAVVLLGSHAQVGSRRRTVVFAGFLILCLLPQQLVFEARAENGGLPGVWAAFLPTIEVAALLALGLLLNSIKGRAGG
jgi:lipopolysaccharide export LptBFGC system permease protein LptF